MESVTASEMKLGDVISLTLCKASYMQATVTGVNNNNVRLHRPYISFYNFSYGWQNNGMQVGPLMGMEEIILEKSSKVEYPLVYRMSIEVP